MAQLRLITILKASCNDDTYRLVAGVAVKLNPPEFDTAINSLSQIIDRKPRDFDAVSNTAPLFHWINVFVMSCYHS
jgi:hypothetical protein